MVPQFGEGFSGEGADAAHVNTVLGLRDGPVGQAWASAMASPSPGHAPFVVVARPNLPVVPFTLFVNKATIAGERHARLTWGAAQAGVAAGVLDARLDDPDGLLCLIAAVWVDPAAGDEDAVFANSRAATLAALTTGAAGGPWIGHLREVDTPSNAFYSAPVPHPFAT
jgi:5,6,7,8-tetrahydromethanopterin hydro-lyase